MAQKTLRKGSDRYPAENGRNRFRVVNGRKGGSFRARNGLESLERRRGGKKAAALAVLLGILILLLSAFLFLREYFSCGKYLRGGKSALYG